MDIIARFVRRSWDIVIWANASKMQEKCLSPLESTILVQREFRRLYGTETAPTGKCIRNWFRQFESTGTILHRKRSGRPRTGDDTTKRVGAAMVQSPHNSMRSASLELRYGNKCSTCLAM